ncbi:uncharacterized protein [Parasteatoda tepidariorum]|uniref:uncharacterized protein n=1 Tax=Parasteatoda tepidariorum TaxID=114398 RepID=UPI0039BC40E6
MTRTLFLSTSIFFCSLAFSLSHAYRNINSNADDTSSSLQIQPMDLPGARRIFHDFVQMKPVSESVLPNIIKISGKHFENSDAMFQKNHLRYLMSSTAEQPDNSSRSSAFSIWLTILIAALAAAIMS